MVILSSIASILGAAKAALKGGVAATFGGAAASKEVFDYNRENFMEDREQRMKMCFQERHLRVEQGKLWREDVRDFVSLTERKMKYYLLVNVLLLGFNVNLWCEGRLPEHTPDWLLMGNQIATAGSFLFLLLTVWLSMHAAVAAQSYQARVLTQLVRLPVPTWTEIEACRTYASDFETLGTKQIFRVPFLSGHQERLVASSASAPVPSSCGAAVQSVSDVPSASPAASAAGPVTAAAVGPALASMAADPWGLERRGDDVYEMGTQYGQDVANLRHIKLIRQAAVYWQTYDAFARVSMSIGVNQLMLAMSYYLMGYAMLQVHTPMAAWVGVLCLIGTMQIVVYIDLTLPTYEERVIQFLIFAGPCLSCFAARIWNIDDEYAISNCYALAVMAFFCQGLQLMLQTVLLSVREQQNGAMMPLAFKGVLYLDVFGWIHEKPQAAKPVENSLDGEGEEKTLAPIVSAPPLPIAPIVSTKRDTNFVEQVTPEAKDPAGMSSGQFSYYAQEYIEDDPSLSENLEQESISDAMPLRPARLMHDTASGNPIPLRPDDLMLEGAHNDMSDVPGAPRMVEQISAVDAPAKEFFEPVTFMPQSSRTRRSITGLFGNVNAPPSEKGNAPARVDEAIVTGHDRESPGLIPWSIFRSSVLTLCIIWYIAAWVSLMRALGPEYQGPFSLPSWLIYGNNEEKAAREEQNTPLNPPSSLVELWSSELMGRTVGRLEAIDVLWPYQNIMVHGLSCDSTGRKFVVSDGVSTLLAEFVEPHVHESTARKQRRSSPKASSAFLLKLDTGEHAEEHIRSSTRFLSTPRCAVLGGDAVLDSSIVCSNRSQSPSDADCEVLVLHSNGQRVAICPLGADSSSTNLNGNAQYPSEDFTIADSWLERGSSIASSGSAAHTLRKLDESISCILTQGDCVGGVDDSRRLGNCAAVGTSRGRVVRLRDALAQSNTASEQFDQEESARSHVLVPSDEIDQEDEHDLEYTAVAREPGIVRALNGRYLGSLEQAKRRVHVLDRERGGSPVGMVTIPWPGREGSTDVSDGVASFCAGGGFLYVLGAGPDPKLWRLPLPDSLSSRV